DGDEPFHHPAPRSLSLELHVLVRARERKAGDEPEARLLDFRPVAAHRGELHDRGEHRLVVDQLLDALQRGLAALAVELRRLLAEEAIDVRVAAVDVRATDDDERLEPGRGAAEGRARAQYQALELLLDLPLVVGGALEGLELRADAGRAEIVHHGLGD